MKDHNPTYYAIIPANVRYDKALPMGAKMMFGEITALSNAKGYCFATNGYFAELYGVTKQGISKWIKQLEAAGYVRVEYVENEGNQQRRVSILVEGGQPQLRGGSTPVDHNNTSNNNSLSTKSEIRSHRVAQAMETIKSHVGDSLATMATVFTEISPGDLNLQVEKWLKYYIGNDEVMSDPIASLTTGPYSFERWIEKAKDVTKKRKPKDMTIVYNSYLKWVKENYNDVKPLSSDEYLGIEAYRKRCELRDQTIVMGLVSASHYDAFFSGGNLIEILNSKLSSNKYPSIEEMANSINKPLQQ